MQTDRTAIFGKEKGITFSFRRDFVDDVIAAIQSSIPVTFLIGPRKCGKTVCLKQVTSMYSNAEYYDIKQLPQQGRSALPTRICDSIRSNSDVIFLVDEVTYWLYPDNIIASFADAYAEQPKSKTRIILAGSQSQALECWGHRSFAGNANFIRMSFMNYSEWLRYTNSIAGPDSYNDFLYHIDKFYGMVSLVDYLQGCLDETVISNNKASDVVLNNACELIDVNLLLDLLYVILISRHNRINAQTVTRENLLIDDISYLFSNCFSDEIIARAKQFLLLRYSAIHNRSLAELRQAVQFLYNCGLISITYTIPNIKQEIDIHGMLFKDSLFELNIRTKADFFSKFNFSIKHPMFYLAVLKILLQEDMPAELPQQLLGSLVECHIRGLLPEAYGCEYHDEDDNEVDYLNQAYGFAIEITVSNKKLRNTHFDCVADVPLKILTTGDHLEEVSDIYKIPYYTLIEYLSRRYSGNPRLDKLVQYLFSRR